MAFSERKAFHPVRKFNEATLVTFLTAVLLGWLSVPIVIGATGAILFFVVVAIIILVLRLLDRDVALWIVIGVLLGFAVDLLLKTSSSALAGEELVGFSQFMARRNCIGVSNETT